MTVAESGGARGTILEEAERVARVAERVEQLLKLAEITAAEADRLIPRPRNSTGLLLRNQPDPQCTHAIAYADLFGVSLDWLIAGRGPDPDPPTIRASIACARAAHAARGENGKTETARDAA